MSTDTKHTALPWYRECGSLVIRDSKGNRLALVSSIGAPTVQAEADAEFIVRVANNHDSLLQALKDALYCLETVAKNEGFDIEVGVVPQARAAIAKAEGRES